MRVWEKVQGEVIIDSLPTDVFLQHLLFLVAARVGDFSRWQSECMDRFINLHVEGQILDLNCLIGKMGTPAMVIFQCNQAVKLIKTIS